MKPSEEFIALAKKYLAMVDEEDGHCSTKERDEERTKTHDELIIRSIKDGISPERRPNRAKIRWLARYLVQPENTQYKFESKATYIMFVKDDFVLSPIHIPPFDEKAEKIVQQFYYPVKVTIEPLFSKSEE